MDRLLSSSLLGEATPEALLSRCPQGPAHRQVTERFGQKEIWGPTECGRDTVRGTLSFRRGCFWVARQETEQLMERGPLRDK